MKRWGRSGRRASCLPYRVANFPAELSCLDFTMQLQKYEWLSNLANAAQIFSPDLNYYLYTKLHTISHVVNTQKQDGVSTNLNVMRMALSARFHTTLLFLYVER